jgi:Flp pilus assembly pilin Flp
MRESRAPESGVDMMQSRIRRWLQIVMQRVQAGQGLAEYGLIVTLISVAAIAIMSVLGTSIGSLYSQAGTVFPR